MNYMDFPDCCGAIIGYKFYTGSDSRNTVPRLELSTWFQNFKNHYFPPLMLVITNAKQRQIEPVIRQQGGKKIFTFNNDSMGRNHPCYIWAIPLRKDKWPTKSKR